MTNPSHPTSEEEIDLYGLLNTIKEELNKIEKERAEWGYASDNNHYACVRAIDRIGDYIGRLPSQTDTNTTTETK
jgi:hypothetical protein